MRQKTIDAIMAHAATEYPRECCGVVVQKSRVERYFPCRNQANEPTEHFVLSPEDYAAAEDWGTVTAIVHSHPDATTQPSELDKAQCDLMAVPGTSSVGRKATYAQSTRAANCRCWNGLLCWGYTTAGGW